MPHNLMIFSILATRLQSASQTNCPLILTSDRLNKYVDADGSMTFQLGVKIYLVNGKEAKTFVTEGCALNDLSTPRIMNFALEDKNDLEQLDYQLGDVKTSDVNISVVNDSEKEVRVFYCHSRVLSGTEVVKKCLRVIVFNDWLNELDNLACILQIKVPFFERCLRRTDNKRR